MTSDYGWIFSREIRELSSPVLIAEYDEREHLSALCVAMTFIAIEANQ